MSLPQSPHTNIPAPTEQLLRQITRRIVQKYHPQLVIFFGSRVYGRPRADSDIDLLVVRNARGSWWQRNQKIARLFPNSPVKLDAHVYTPREAAHRLEIGDYFMQDVMERGRILYPRANGNGVARLLREKLQQGKEHPMNEEYIEEWIAKAEGDYKSARALARQRKDFSADNLCWTCAQCVEKYFKTFLVRHRVKFERTHNLVKLHEQCMTIDGDFKLLADLLKPLTLCEPPIRYPGASVSEADARAAFNVMKDARTFVRANLGLR